MREKTWFEKTLDSVKDSLEYRLEGIILKLTEQVCQRMMDKHITRTQLAEKLQVSPAAITKILNGNSNFTLRTLLSLGDALNLDLGIEFRPTEISAQGLFEVWTSAGEVWPWTGTGKLQYVTTTAWTHDLLMDSPSGELSVKAISSLKQKREQLLAA